MRLEFKIAIGVFMGTISAYVAVRAPSWYRENVRLREQQALDRKDSDEKFNLMMLTPDELIAKCGKPLMDYSGETRGGGAARELSYDFAPTGDDNWRDWATGAITYSFRITDGGKVPAEAVPTKDLRQHHEYLFGGVYDDRSAINFASVTNETVHLTENQTVLATYQDHCDVKSKPPLTEPEPTKQATSKADARKALARSKIVPQHNTAHSGAGGSADHEPVPWFMGTPSGTQQATAPDQSSGVFKVGGGVSAPVLIHQVLPQSSEEARAARISGTVLMETIVRKDGSVHVVRVARALGYGLDEQAIKTAEQWIFKPGMKNGQPVDVSMYIEVNFNAR